MEVFGSHNILLIVFFILDSSPYYSYSHSMFAIRRNKWLDWSGSIGMVNQIQIKSAEVFHTPSPQLHHGLKNWTENIINLCINRTHRQSRQIRVVARNSAFFLIFGPIPNMNRMYCFGIVMKISAWHVYFDGRVICLTLILIWPHSIAGFCLYSIKVFCTRGMLLLSLSWRYNYNI